MDHYGRSIRMGAMAIALAVVVRLGNTGFALPKWVADPGFASFLIYLETGRVARPLPETTSPPETEPTLPQSPVERPAFSASEEDLVLIRGAYEGAIPVGALLEEPLEWELAQESPVVLILHTHGSEAYRGTVNYRSLDTAQNMISLGDVLAAELEEAGIGVIHDRTIYDHPEYDGSYYRSEAAALECLSQNPGVEMVLDLHRDAATNPDGSQYATSALADGERCAQIMFLVSTQQEHWRQNMALAAKLTAWLERHYPGITRGILTRTTDYNQGVSPGALLVEIGAAGNTHEEAVKATEILGRAIIALKNGTAIPEA